MEGLLPLNQTAQLVTHDLAYHDYEGIALDHDERPRLQKDLGNKNHMLLRNHGTLTVGRSVASAFERMFHLERACTMQVRTRMLGPTAYPVEQAVVDKNAQPVLRTPTGRNCARPRWYGRRCCASSTGSTPATRIENLEFWCSVAAQRPLHFSIKTPPNSGRRFHLSGRSACRPADVGDLVGGQTTPNRSKMVSISSCILKLLDAAARRPTNRADEPTATISRVRSPSPSSQANRSSTEL